MAKRSMQQMIDHCARVNAQVAECGLPGNFLEVSSSYNYYMICGADRRGASGSANVLCSGTLAECEAWLDGYALAMATVDFSRTGK